MSDCNRCLWATRNGSCASWDCRFVDQREAYEAYNREKADANKWIPCSERLPDNRECVLICYREWQQYAKRYVHTIVLGWHANKHSVNENVFNEWEADCDYVEEEDEFYIREGWYEMSTQGNSDWWNWFINAEVIAWMPLPEPYKEKEDGCVHQ